MNLQRLHRIILYGTALMILPGFSTAKLRVDPLISDGMVLQRDTAPSVWGVAEPGDEVAVTFRGQSVSTHANEDGRWRVELSAAPAGGPFEMTIAAAAETLLVRDILVGDVWVCSGQSNMEWVVADSVNAPAEMALASDPTIRHFKVPRSWAAKPEENLAGGSWEPADSDHVGAFTAVGYFFARQLSLDVDVPIGLINTSWGGSRIEPWMSAAALGLDDEGLRREFEKERDYEQEVRQMIAAKVGDVPDRDRGIVAGRAVWAHPDLDDSSWEEMPVPAAWEGAGYPGMDGVAWYRTSFHLTAEQAQQVVRLGLGAIDDSDTSWVNGHEVGRTEMAWNQPRVYEVPSASLEPGTNVIAVRVEDTGGGGGIQGDPALLFVEVGGHRRSLVGMWRFALGVVTVNLEDHKREVPTVLYNRMIHPLQQLPIKGVLWYQGESNADSMEDAVAYGDLFPDMIQDWRRGWANDELPFLYVQLANFMPPPSEPAESIWAVMRESQSKALALPSTAQVVTIDVGEALDVHPRNKQAVGQRLALAARSVAYGQEVVFSGPVLQSDEIKGGRVLLAFDHIGSGLTAMYPSGARLRGFVIAGADRRFVWANATIEGIRVVVWSPEVPEPVAVRYGWADNPEGANLYNREGLPASPFRTDSW